MIFRHPSITGEVCLGIVEWTKSHRKKAELKRQQRILHITCLFSIRWVRKVTVELEKPGAPVPYAFDTVLVHIERSRHQAFLGIGSNLGDRQMNLAAAIRLLEQCRTYR